jgi:hypothetical protein
MSEAKFAEFLKTKKLDLRRIQAASHNLESFKPEDRAIRLSKRQAKTAGDGEKKVEKETRKSRSGRPVTGRALAIALAGGSLPGPIKHRILRAVNHLLEQKKQDKIELRTLF